MNIPEEEVRLSSELRDKWVAALRSGEYKQTTQVLHRDGKHCCLGVLDLITDDTRPILSALVGVDRYSYLVNMNDQEMKTFPQIADFIEAWKL